MDKTTSDASVATIGIDLAKNVFQVHAINASGVVVVRRAVKRRDLLAFAEKLLPCVIGMEACATAHRWARELARLASPAALPPSRRACANSRPPTAATARSAASPTDGHAGHRFAPPAAGARPRASIRGWKRLESAKSTS
jgi:transposase